MINEGRYKDMNLPKCAHIATAISLAMRSYSEEFIINVTLHPNGLWTMQYQDKNDSMTIHEVCVGVNY